MKSFAITVMVDNGKEKQYFHDTLDAQDEQDAQNKGMAEYMQAYPRDIIAIGAQEIDGDNYG